MNFQEMLMYVQQNPTPMVITVFVLFVLLVISEYLGVNQNSKISSIFELIKAAILGMKNEVFPPKVDTAVVAEQPKAE